MIACLFVHAKKSRKHNFDFSGGLVVPQSELLGEEMQKMPFQYFLCVFARDVVLYIRGIRQVGEGVKRPAS